MDDPSQTGVYSVKTLFYGSGNDQHRPEFGKNVELITKPVDGSKLVEGWTGLRTNYWGFSPEAIPVNGRVWMPEGAGPFPLVLIVHGNHLMKEASDPGYEYLGELLASLFSAPVTGPGFLPRSSDCRSSSLWLSHRFSW